MSSAPAPAAMAPSSAASPVPVAADLGLRALRHVFLNLELDGVAIEWGDRRFTWREGDVVRTVWAETDRAEPDQAESDQADARFGRIARLVAATDVVTGIAVGPETSARVSRLNMLLGLCGATLTGGERAATLRLVSRISLVAEQAPCALQVFAWAIEAQAVFAREWGPGIAGALGGSFAAEAEAGPRPHAARPGSATPLPAAAATLPGDAPRFTPADLDEAAQAGASAGVMVRQREAGYLQLTLRIGRLLAIVDATLAMPHPRLGAGLAIRLLVPMAVGQRDAVQWASFLNAIDGPGGPVPSYLGAWAADPLGFLSFRTFYPDASQPLVPAGAACLEHFLRAAWCLEHVFDAPGGWPAAAVSAGASPH